jgi:large subunit ribosomal protein L35
VPGDENRLFFPGFFLYTAKALSGFGPSTWVHPRVAATQEPSATPDAFLEHGVIMGKQKTVKAARGRTKITGTGKVMAWKAGKRHLSYHKSGKEIQGKGVAFVISDADTPRFKQMLPYGDR